MNQKGRPLYVTTKSESQIDQSLTGSMDVKMVVKTCGATRERKF